MSHQDQMEFFETWIQCFPELFAGDVIDFGSWDVNGGPHNRISPRNYTGVDLAPGPNVNLVSPGELVDLPSASFDVCMSSECFEHAPSWQQILGNMCRMAKPGGMVVFTCAGLGRATHGTESCNPDAAQAALSVGQNYYRNVLPRDVRLALNLEYFFDDYVLTENLKASDTYFSGLRSGASPSARDAFVRAKTAWLRRPESRLDLMRTRVYRRLGDKLVRQIRRRRLAGLSGS
jgi:SAM-dependent methyltransferase